MIWLDAHLSPRIARWMEEELGQACRPLRDLGLQKAKDAKIFARARDDNAILLTKDQDFAEFVSRLGPPPRVVWLRVGNTSEDRLKDILVRHLRNALDLIDAGNPLVEIKDEPNVR